MKKAVFLLLLLPFFHSCQRNAGVENRAVGYAQGTYYQIKYITPEGEDWQASFDSIFKVVDHSMSTYLDNSTISTINQGDTMVKVDPLFTEVLERSLEIAEETNGMFDPTVGPLVALWGFGTENPEVADTSDLGKVRRQVGYDKVRVKGSRVGLPSGSRLDFNAIAQGYTVDVISRFIEERGVERYMVEVGGEVRARGKNINGQVWRIGIDKPSEELDEHDRFQLIVALEDRSLATSGNYRKFWVDEETGIKYAHSIDPHTGRPARNRLLSVSVISHTCMDADAYATAFMVMGTEDALKLARGKKGLEAYFISSDGTGGWKTSQTAGFEDYVLN